MGVSRILLICVIGLYLSAFLRYGFDFLRGRRKHAAWSDRLMEAGFLVHTLQIFVHTFSAARMTSPNFYLPVGSLGENSGFFAWSLAFVYLTLVRRFKAGGFGLVLSPTLILFLIPSLFSFPTNPRLLPYLNDSYFLLHILSAFFGYACFALSFIAGLLYLIQDRALKLKVHFDFYRKLPPLKGLERFVFQTIFWGLLLLGGAIVTGGFWTKRAFGTFVLPEPKSLATLVTWFAYLAILYLHGVSLMKGRRIVRLSVWAFALVLFTFLGTSVFQSKLHAGL